MERLKQAAKTLLLKNPRKANYKFLLKDWVRFFDGRASAQVLETKRFTQTLEPAILDAPEAKRILVIAPHTDDDVFGAGGTLLKAMESGAAVDVLYVTGGVGSPREQEVRRETTEVCTRMGTRPTFLEQQTKNIPLDDPAVNERVVALIRRVEPEIIFTSFLLDDHDDHRRVNQLLLHLGPEIVERNIEVWAYQIYSTVIPNVVVNITAYAQRKRDVMRLWQSVRGERDWVHYIMGMNAANCRYIPERGEVYAEAFFVVPIREYLDLCSLYFGRDPAEVYATEAYRSASA